MYQTTILKRLRMLHVFILFLTTIVFILPSHLFPQPYFMYSRFPYYLEMMGPFLGISWPLSFKIYHAILLSLAIIATLNMLGLTYTNWKRAATVSSFLGVFLISFMVIFYLFFFIKVDLSTALTYGAYSVFLWIVNLLTLYSLTIYKQRK